MWIKPSLPFWAIAIPSQTLCSSKEPLTLLMIETVYRYGFCVAQGNNQVACNQTRSQDSTYLVPRGSCTNGPFKCLDLKQKCVQMGPCLLTMLILGVTTIQGGPAPVGQSPDTTQADCCLTSTGQGKHRHGAQNECKSNSPFWNRSSEASPNNPQHKTEYNRSAATKQLDNQGNSLTEVVLQNKEDLTYLSWNREDFVQH